MKMHCGRSDRADSQMYCGRSIYKVVFITSNWDETTCRPCRRAIKKKQVEYRDQNPHLAHLLGPVLSEATFAERAVELEEAK